MKLLPWPTKPAPVPTRSGWTYHGNRITPGRWQLIVRSTYDGTEIHSEVRVAAGRSTAEQLAEAALDLIHSEEASGL